MAKPISVDNLKSIRNNVEALWDDLTGLPMAYPVLDSLDKYTIPQLVELSAAVRNGNAGAIALANSFIGQSFDTPFTSYAAFGGAVVSNTAKVMLIGVDHKDANGNSEGLTFQINGGEAMQPIAGIVWNSSGKTTGGYAQSEVRTTLTSEDFMSKIDSNLVAVMRATPKEVHKGSGLDTEGIEVLTDKLWLLSANEMGSLGSVCADGLLEGTRYKYFIDHPFTSYSNYDVSQGFNLRSVMPDSDTTILSYFYDGLTIAQYPEAAGGVSPCFCI